MIFPHPSSLLGRVDFVDPVLSTKQACSRHNSPEDKNCLWAQLSKSVCMMSYWVEMYWILIIKIPRLAYTRKLFETVVFPGSSSAIEAPKKNLREETVEDLLKIFSHLFSSLDPEKPASFKPGRVE